MRPQSVAVLLAAAAASLTLPPAAVDAAAPTAISPGHGARIDTVVIEGNTRTRTEIVRRELLFDVGDLIDSSLVAESERNLRRLPYLGNARVDLRQDAGTTVAQVAVDDLYSRALSPQFAGDLDELSYGLSGLDYNFLGRGQTVELAAYRDAVSGNSASAYYHVPRFRRSDVNATLLARAGEEGHDLGLGLSRPFRALSDSWSFGLALTRSREVRRLYDRERLTARYSDRIDKGSIWLSHSNGSRLKLRLTISISVSDRRFASEDEALPYAPADRRRLLAGAGILLWQPRYAVARYVHGLGRTEDLQTGSWASLSVTMSTRRLVSDRDFTVFRLGLAPRYSLADRIFLFGSMNIAGRRERHDLINRTAVAQLRLYARLLAAHSAALRLRYDAIDDPEDQAQFLLGTLRGLRGYAPRRFDGSRRILFNLEARPTFYHHPLFVLAGALFVDAGRAWNPGSAGQVKWGFGAGGRIGLPRVYNNPVMRADLAYGAADRVWQLSVGIGQYF